MTDSVYKRFIHYFNNMKIVDEKNNSYLFINFSIDQDKKLVLTIKNENNSNYNTTIYEK